MGSATKPKSRVTCKSDTDPSSPPGDVRHPARSLNKKKLIVCKKTPPIHHNAHVFYYTAHTLADLLGWGARTVEQRIVDGKLDPASLESICENWLRTKQREGYDDLFGEREDREVTFGGETFKFKV